MQLWRYDGPLAEVRGDYPNSAEYPFLWRRRKGCSNFGPPYRFQGAPGNFRARKKASPVFGVVAETKL
jgi:hypothetical protein